MFIKKYKYNLKQIRNKSSHIVHFIMLLSYSLTIIYTITGGLLIKRSTERYKKEYVLKDENRIL